MLSYSASQVCLYLLVQGRQTGIRDTAQVALCSQVGPPFPRPPALQLHSRNTG